MRESRLLSHSYSHSHSHSHPIDIVTTCHSFPLNALPSQILAVKEIPFTASDASDVDNLRLEVECMKRWDHPNIVRFRTEET